MNPLPALNITGGGDVTDFSVDDVITSASGAKAFVAYVDGSGSNNKHLQLKMAQEVQPLKQHQYQTKRLIEVQVSSYS